MTALAQRYFSIIIFQFVLVLKMCVNENRENSSTVPPSNVLFCVYNDSAVPSLLPFLFGTSPYFFQISDHF